MKRHWIKLWLDIIDDPKMGRLPDHIWRRAVEVFLMAGEYGDEGFLPSENDMAWRLRTDETNIRKDLQCLEEAGLLVKGKDDWKVKNFKKRQWSESLERVKKFREGKKKRNGYSNGSGSGDVTSRESSSASASVSSSSSLSSSGSSSCSLEDVTKVYEENIGHLTPYIVRSLDEAYRIYSGEWCLAAFEEAAKSNVFSWKYVETILARWKAEGFKSKSKAQRVKELVRA